MAPHRWDPREREESILRIHAREEAALQPSHTKMHKKNSVRVPDPNYSSLASVQFSQGCDICHDSSALPLLLILFRCEDFQEMFVYMKSLRDGRVRKVEREKLTVQAAV